MKKCIYCGKSSKKSRCATCGQKEKTRQKEIYKEMVLANICPRCRKTPLPKNKKACLECLDKLTQKYKQNQLENLKYNLCGRCGNNYIFKKHKNCEECIKKDRKWRKKRRLELLDLGLCVGCGKDKYLETLKTSLVAKKMCLKCYMKNRSRSILGSIEYCDELLSRLKNQNYICPYTGDKIIIGINDSIDHILPRSRFPELSKDINNVHWVSRTTNQMKLNYTEKEFKILIKKIYEHLKLDYLTFENIEHLSSS